MVNGLYSAASAMDAAQQKHDVVAQNLANANVSGYRRRGLSFEQLLAQSTSQVGSGVTGTRSSKEYSAFDAGPMQYTGNPLDAAVQGDSFFVLQGPKGPLYTRNGNFQINGKGQLQSSSGLLVNGTNGPIQIPADSKQITISPDGTVLADKNPVGQLQLAHFADDNNLIPAGTTLFTAPADVQPQTSTDKVLQGYREGSNVQVVNEMVNMIAGMRHFEAAQHALKTISDAVQQNTRPQAG
jgi:flagellar basal-body rod protein FlgF